MLRMQAMQYQHEGQMAMALSMSFAGLPADVQNQMLANGLPPNSTRGIRRWQGATSAPRGTPLLARRPRGIGARGTSGLLAPGLAHFPQGSWETLFSRSSCQSAWDQALARAASRKPQKPTGRPTGPFLPPEAPPNRLSHMIVIHLRDARPPSARFEGNDPTMSPRAHEVRTRAATLKKHHRSSETAMQFLP